MCCEHDQLSDLGARVAEMLVGYEQAHAADPTGRDWGQEMGDAFGGTFEFARFSDYRSLARGLYEMARAGEAVTAANGLWRAASASPPPGLVVIDITDAGLEVRTGTPVPLPPGTAGTTTVLARSTRVDDTALRLHDRSVVLATGLAVTERFSTADLVDGLSVSALDTERRVEVARVVDAASVVVRSDHACRWSVVDAGGHAWFPADALRKFDVHGRPWFAAKEAALTVAPGTVLVSASRGMEFAGATATVQAAPGARAVVELRPARRWDAAARGWYGGDLHVHLNYSGDHVAHPAHAAAMQQAEGLHLLNLVAANFTGSLIYEQEALEDTLGVDLPWSCPHQVARFGVEYRNDLLGHVHALGLTATPSRYHTGHAGSDEPDDWPPNAVALREMRGLGALIGYTHPVGSAIHDMRSAFIRPRSCEAREAVADAALGLVDSIDILGPNATPDGNVELLRRMLNCGLRLAATAGTDAMLSMEQVHVFSNPPGWARVYADLDGAALGVDAFQAAVRAGRTFVTNGPWIELAVDGHGPGAVIEVAAATTVVATARCVGAGVAELFVAGPDGPLGSVAVDGEEAELAIELDVAEPGWLWAVARGGPHPEVLYSETYAQTSPVYLEIGGAGIARRQDAAWCVEWLDEVESLAARHGRFSSGDQLADLVAVLDEARAFYRAI